MRKTSILFFLLLTTLLQTQGQPDAPFKFGPNYRIHPSSTDQTEVFIVRSPQNPNVLFSACNTLRFQPQFFISEGIYATENGGDTWYGSDTCSGEIVNLHGGDPGIAIDRNGTFILTRMGRAPLTGLYSHYSTDHGRSWSAQRVISSDDLERAAVATDAVPSSPFYGRTYAAWVKFATPFPVMAAYTDNGAQAWSAQQQVNNPSYRSAGGDLAIGPNGEVYCCWAGVTDISPFKEVLVGFAKSADGAATWNVTENAFAINGINGVLPNKGNIRVNGLPCIAVDTTQGAYRGRIYILTTQRDNPPAGSDPDIVLYRSSDGGQSWSAGIRVNQDPLNNGKTQYFPNIHIDRSGTLNIIFFDDRTTTNDSTGVFLARSSDGGDTWKEYEISDHHFKPVPIGGLAQGYQGDIIDITSTETKLWPVWMDNSSGKYQVWTVPIAFTELGTKEIEAGGPRLVTCRPNPFGAETTIGYRVPAAGEVSLVLYDLLSREVARLASGRQEPGTYSIRFSPAEGDCFIYRFRAGERSETGKILRAGD